MLTGMIAAALVLDLILGDPRSWPHPVIWIGRVIALGEKITCRYVSSPLGLRLGGGLLVMAVVGGTYFIVFSLLALLRHIHPVLGAAGEIWLLYRAFAVKGLHQHAAAVAEPLARQDLAAARAKVGLIVGRDTDNLDEKEVTRAVVETVAENTVDGIVAPLCYAFIGGAPLAWVYKAVNTLDSMVGYKEAHYRHLGLVAAKLDDAANYLPARLAGLLLLVMAPFTPGGLGRVWRTMKRDARKHPSPNGGIMEAGVAGALGVQLGGLNYYFGQPSFRATMGDPLQPLQVKHIYQAVRIMYGITCLAVLLGAVLRSVI